jgi:hypothetical protein
LRDRGVYADYEHNTAVEAIKDFCRLMPGGEVEYLSELREFVLRLYARASDGSARYFLDKTPPYSLVAEQVMQLFPEGKFIFLWRNPLSIVASMLEAPWVTTAGEWNIFYYDLALFEGLEGLVEAYRRHKEEVHAIRYEDIVADPYGELGKAFNYLELPYDPSSLDQLRTVKLEGRFKDQFGISTPLFFHDRVSAEP